MLTIDIFGDVTSSKDQLFMSLVGLPVTGFTAESIHDLLNTVDDKDILFNLRSDGGIVDEGIAIYDILRTSGRNIYMNVIGDCHSIATVVLLAAPFENRTANPNATFLIHPVHVGVPEGYYPTDVLAYQLENGERQRDRILDIYAERTTMPREELAEIMEQSKFHSATDMLNMGFISSINQFNTNQKQKAMKNNKTAAQKFLNSLQTMFGGAFRTANYDFTDSEGTLLFSTASEDDTLEVDMPVKLAEGYGSSASFDLPDGRHVEIEDNVIVEVSIDEPGDYEEFETMDRKTLIRSCNVMRGKLAEAQIHIQNLLNEKRTTTNISARSGRPAAPSKGGNPSKESYKDELRQKREARKEGARRGVHANRRQNN